MGFNLELLSLSRAPDCSLQFTLLTSNFLLFDLNLLTTSHNIDFNFFLTDVLLELGSSELISQLSLGLLSIDFLIECVLRELKLTLAVSHASICRKASLLLLTLSISFLNAGVSVCLSNANVGISFHFSSTTLAKGSEVTNLVIQVHNCEGKNIKTHFMNVGLCDFFDKGSKLFTILVNFLNSQCAENSTEVTFQRLVDNNLNFGHRSSKEVLGSNLELSHIVGSEAHLCNSCNGQTDTKNGFNVLALGVQSHHLKRHSLHVGNTGTGPSVAANNNTFCGISKTATANNERFVRTSNVTVAHFDEACVRTVKKV
eukprot:Colp12_sorted_trinity150504_noHs@4148